MLYHMESTPHKLTRSFKGGGCKLGPFPQKNFFSKMIIFRGNFMRGIDCAHSQKLKTLPWSWFRGKIGFLKRKSNIFGFLWENRRFLCFSRRGIDCTHSRTLKTLPWPWFREEIGVLKRKSENVWFSLQYTQPIPWIRVKEAFSRFENARNRFLA